MADSVRIYKVLDPSPLFAARDQLAGLFAQRVPDERVTFAFSPECSRLWFSDDRVLWQCKDPSRLPATPLDAEKAARSFMGRINSAIQKDKAFQAAGFSALFPDDCRPVPNGLDPSQTVPGASTQSVLVTNPSSILIDHWLVRFEAYLPTGGAAGSIPVYGARVDIRVGQDGAIGACWVNWRVSIPQGVTPLLDLSSSSGDSNQGEDNGDEETVASPILVYLLSDEGTTQSYLAPYYFYPDEDDGYYAPATAYSLVAEMTDESSGDENRVGCVVAGGSGNYEYRWLGWEATRAMEGPEELGSDDSVVLQPGSYNLVLRVQDTQTQMMVFVERTILTSMLGDPNN